MLVTDNVVNTLLPPETCQMLRLKSVFFSVWRHYINSQWKSIQQIQNTHFIINTFTSVIIYSTQRKHMKSLWRIHIMSTLADTVKVKLLSIDDVISLRSDDLLQAPVSWKFVTRGIKGSVQMLNQSCICLANLHATLEWSQPNWFEKDVQGLVFEGLVE